MSDPAGDNGRAPPSVLLADPQPTVRASLRHVLERDGFVVCGEAAEAREAAVAAEREQPDLCVIEILIPGGGVRAIGSIRARSPKTEVVVITAARDRDRLFEAIRAGAAGYLLKSMNPDRIPNALRGVLEGEAAIPRTLVAALLSDFQSHGTQRLLVGRRGRAQLTRREWEVARLIAAGESTDQVAATLFISPVTVRRHLSSVVRKLGVTSRRAAIELLGGELDSPPRRRAP
jgi:DNA-binding NarL/FixJ family response regulator